MRFVRTGSMIGKFQRPPGDKLQEKDTDDCSTRVREHRNTEVSLSFNHQIFHARVSSSRKFQVWFLVDLTYVVDLIPKERP